jgi:hypothetical protein
MTILILQIILGIIGVSAAVFTWWVKANDSKIKAKEEEDAKIDAINSADDVIHESGNV